jgi:hypothetical protein
VSYFDLYKPYRASAAAAYGVKWYPWGAEPQMSGGFLNAVVRAMEWARSDIFRGGANLNAMPHWARWVAAVEAAQQGPDGLILDPAPVWTRLFQFLAEVKNYTPQANLGTLIQYAKEETGELVEDAKRGLEFVVDLLPVALVVAVVIWLK